MFKPERLNEEQQTGHPKYELQYFRQLLEYPTLSNEQTRNLLKKLQDAREKLENPNLTDDERRKQKEGFIEVRNQLIVANLNSIPKVMLYLDHLKLEIDDSLSAGLEGLILAFNSYDLRKKGVLFDYVKRGIIRKIKYYESVFSSGFSKESIEDLSFEDERLYIEQTTAKTDIERISSQQDITCVHDFLPMLDEHERMIIEMRYGLNGESEQTLAQIGDIFRLTDEGIRQIEIKALKKLRCFIQEDGLPEHGAVPPIYKYPHSTQKKIQQSYDTGNGKFNYEALTDQQIKLLAHPLIIQGNSPSTRFRLKLNAEQESLTLEESISLRGDLDKSNKTHNKRFQDFVESRKKTYARFTRDFRKKKGNSCNYELLDGSKVVVNFNRYF